jgi:hypothetical protein
VTTAGSYQSASDKRLLVGLGDATVVRSIEVRWPSGKLETFKDVLADKIYTVFEGQGIKDSAPFNKQQVSPEMR